MIVREIADGGWWNVQELYERVKMWYREVVRRCLSSHNWYMQECDCELAVVSRHACPLYGRGRGKWMCEMVVAGISRGLIGYRRNAKRRESRGAR